VVRPSWRECGWLLLGAVALIVNWLCLFRAYEYSGIAIATVVYHVQPFLLLLLAALLQGEPLPLSRLPWLVLALIGVGLSGGLLGWLASRHRKGNCWVLGWRCWRPVFMPWPLWPPSGSSGSRRRRLPCCRCWRER
jgi:drug/metabolite transporter (DMT)-like permease